MSRWKKDSGLPFLSIYFFGIIGFMNFRHMQSKGMYHLALIVVAVASFNWAFIELVNVNIVTRVFQNVVIPHPILPIVVCISAIMVLWHNWVD